MTALDLTPGEHSQSAVVEQAAQWLSDQPPGTMNRPIPELRGRFPLSPQQACEAIALADRMRILRRAFG